MGQLLPTSSIKGSILPLRQPDEREWSEANGTTTYHVWEGIESAIIGQEALCKQSGYISTSITSRDNVVFRLRAAIPGSADGAEEITEQWDLISSKQQEDVFTHPKIKLDATSEDEINNEDLRIIKQYMDDPQQWSLADTSLNGTVVQPLWELAKRGQRSFQRTYWILRYSLSGKRAMEFNIEDNNNVDHILTWDQLPWDSIEGTPAVYKLLQKIRAAGPPYAAPPFYTWGWLLQGPEGGQSLVNGKANITQEWWYYCWSTFDYDAAT